MGPLTIAYATWVRRAHYAINKAKRYQNHKRDVAKRFSYLTGEETEDVDRRILEIREGLAPKYGEDFYDEDLKRQ